MHHPGPLPWCGQLSQARPKSPTWQQQARKPNPVPWPPQQPQQCHPCPQHHHIHCEESAAPRCRNTGYPLPWCAALIPSQWSWWPCGTSSTRGCGSPKALPPAPADPSGCQQICCSKRKHRGFSPTLPSHLTLLPPFHGNQQSLITKYF